jgi:glycosyltransferase involved in cell wall biosynthesis
MKILYFHQYFNTPAEGGPLRSWHIAKGMADAGHNVVLITAHNYPAAVTKIIDGITIHYLPVVYDNSFGFLRRSFSFLTFILGALKISRKEMDVDLCYATSTPLTVGFIAYWIKRKRSVPYVFEARDLWPAAPIEMGVIKNSIIKKLLFRFEKLIYDHAEKIIALSPGIKEGVARVSPHKKILVVPNMSDCDYFKPESKTPALEVHFGVKDKFVVSYYGAAGKANRLEYLVAVIKHCADTNHSNLFFLIQSKGSELKKIKEQLKNYRNVLFISYGNKESLRQLLYVSDGVYVSFDSKPVLQTTSPNKFFDALAAGKLTIVNTEGWIKELIEKEAIGFYADPLQPQEFVEKILPFINNKTRLLAAQSKARRVAENYFSKELLVNQLLTFLELK